MPDSVRPCRNYVELHIILLYFPAFCDTILILINFTAENSRWNINIFAKVFPAKSPQIHPTISEFAESQWNYWILGLMDLGMNFANWEWSVPYTVIRLVTGVSGTDAVHYGSYNQYVEQFTNTVTRTIFKKRGNTYDSCYQDQTSSLRVKLYFCPVGTAFDSDYIEIRNVFEGEVTANTLTKDEILRVANTYSNHGGEVIYRVSYHRVTEDWGD